MKLTNNLNHNQYPYRNIELRLEIPGIHTISFELGSDQVRHKPTCAATEDRDKLESLDLGRRVIVHSIRVAKTKALINCANTALVLSLLRFMLAFSP